MRTMSKRLKRLAIGMAGLVALTLAGCSTGNSDPAVDGEPIQIRYSSFLPENSVEAEAMNWWFDRVRELTDDAVEFETFYGGSLLSAEETIEGLQTGRADMVLIATNYHPAEFPLSQLASVPFLAENGEASVRALMEIAVGNEGLKAEFARLGVVPINWLIVTNNTMGTREEVTELSDLAGLSIRDAGMSAYALDEIGVNTVALPAAEIYSGIQTGVLDGFAGLPFANAVTSFKMEEVAPHFLDGGLGVYNAVVGGAMTEQKWAELPAEIQEAMTQAAEEVIDFHAGVLAEAGTAACNALQAGGGSVVRLSDADIAEWKEKSLKAVLDSWRSNATSVGVDAATADDFLASYKSLVAKYSATVSYVDPLTACQ